MDYSVALATWQLVFLATAVLASYSVSLLSPSNFDQRSTDQSWSDLTRTKKNFQTLEQQNFEGERNFLAGRGSLTLIIVEWGFQADARSSDIMGLIIPYHNLFETENLV